MRNENFQGAEVCLFLNGQRMQEYSNEDLEEAIPTSICFVEAVAGAEVAVQYTLRRRFKHNKKAVASDLYLDGMHAIGDVWPKDRDCHELKRVDNVLTMEDGVAFERPFLFAELQTTDGALNAEDVDGAMKLGEITVELVWCRKSALRGMRPDAPNWKPLLGSIVPQKALKGRAMSSRTKVGAATEVEDYECGGAEPPYREKPFAVYMFKYLSHRDLQIEGLIPRSPSPVQFVDRDPEELTPEERREQVRLLREQRDALIEQEVSVRSVRIPPPLSTRTIIPAMAKSSLSRPSDLGALEP